MTTGWAPPPCIRYDESRSDAFVGVVGEFLGHARADQVNRLHCAVAVFFSSAAPAGGQAEHRPVVQPGGQLREHAVVHGPKPTHRPHLGPSGKAQPQRRKPIACLVGERKKKKKQQPLLFTCCCDKLTSILVTLTASPLLPTHR